MGTIIGELIGILVEATIAIFIQIFYKIALLLRFKVEDRMQQKTLPNAGYVDRSDELRAALALACKAGRAIDRQNFSQARDYLQQVHAALLRLVQENATHKLVNVITRFGNVRKGTRNAFRNGSVVKGWEEKGRFRLALKLGGLDYIVKEELVGAISFLPAGSGLDVICQGLLEDLVQLSKALRAKNAEACQHALDRIKAAERKLGRWVEKNNPQEIDLLSIAKPTGWMEEIATLAQLCQTVIAHIVGQRHPAAYEGAVALFKQLDQLAQLPTAPHWASASQMLPAFAAALEETCICAQSEDGAWSDDLRIRLGMQSGKLDYLSDQIKARSSRELKMVTAFSDKCFLLNSDARSFLGFVEQRQPDKARESLDMMTSNLERLGKVIEGIKSPGAG